MILTDPKKIAEFIKNNLGCREVIACMDKDYHYKDVQGMFVQDNENIFILHNDPDFRGMRASQDTMDTYGYKYSWFITCASKLSNVGCFIKNLRTLYNKEILLEL